MEFEIYWTQIIFRLLPHFMCFNTLVTLLIITIITIGNYLKMRKKKNNLNKYKLNFQGICITSRENPYFCLSFCILIQNHNCATSSKWEMMMLNIFLSLVEIFRHTGNPATCKNSNLTSVEIRIRCLNTYFSNE